MASACIIQGTRQLTSLDLMQRFGSRFRTRGTIVFCWHVHSLVFWEEQFRDWRYVYHCNPKSHGKPSWNATGSHGPAPPPPYTAGPQQGASASEPEPEPAPAPEPGPDTARSMV